MARIHNEEQEFGSESFLDVVANVVGILIILVMVVGMRIQKSSAEAVEVAVSSLDLPGSQAELRSLAQETQRLAVQTVDLDQEANSRRLQQEQLALALAAQKQDLDARRQQLDAETKRKLDAKRDLWTA